MVRSLALCPWSAVTAAAAVGWFVAPADAEPLRLFAIGDSITQGIGSEDTGGYREALDLALTGAGIDHVFQGRRKDPDLSSDPSITTTWYRHWGRPGISADNPNGGYSHAHPPYSDLHSLVDHFVDRNNIDAAHIRHPDIYGTYDFRNEVWSALTPPTHTLLHIGTNSIESAASTVNSSATQLNSLLKTFDLLDSTLVPNTGSTFMRSDGTILLANIVPKAETLDTLANTFDYNALISDKSSSVYDGLSQDFVDRVTIVDMFKVRVDDVLNAILDRRSDVDESTLLGYLQKDGDEWVDWVLDYDEATGVPGLGALALNDDLWRQQNSTIDGIHPGNWGYEVMAQVWANAIPEPSALALLVLGGAWTAARRVRPSNAG